MRLLKSPNPLLYIYHINIWGCKKSPKPIYPLKHKRKRKKERKNGLVHVGNLVRNLLILLKRRRVGLLGWKWSPKRRRVGLVWGESGPQNDIVLGFWGESGPQNAVVFILACLNQTSSTWRPSLSSKLKLKLKLTTEPCYLTVFPLPLWTVSFCKTSPRTNSSPLKHSNWSQRYPFPCTRRQNSTRN